MPEPATTPSATELPVPTSVWVTAQQDARGQRRGRYLDQSATHPAKMLPAVAAHAIAHYTQPGDLVLDPLCGIGTSLVEAIHQGRDAVGVEYEPRWATIAAGNLEAATRQGATGTANLHIADARTLPGPLLPDLAGRVALVLTSPPYGQSTHGHARTIPTGGVRKQHHRYGPGPDRGQLANLSHPRLLAGLTRILIGCLPLLNPGGHIIITARPWREHGELVDLPSEVITSGRAAGLLPIERCAALLAGLRGNQLVLRASFFQRNLVHMARADGEPWHLITHEDVLIFRAPDNPQRPTTPDAVGDTVAPPTAAPTRPSRQDQAHPHRRCRRRGIPASRPHRTGDAA